jgi:hypothetical protein
MKLKYLVTYFRLPPGPPSSEDFLQLVQLVFKEYRWFRPERYGRALMKERLAPDVTDFDALVSYYDEFRNITIAARTDRDFVMLAPAKAHDPNPLYTGVFTWTTSMTEAKKPAWRNAHVPQVLEVMRRLGSPFAYSGLSEDLVRKKRLLVPAPNGVGSIETFTVLEPSEGLAGLYWRNFFGPPLTRMFGDRLLSLPPGMSQDLGNGSVLVQPYELPTQAMTPEGDAAEQRLITVLGPECFYDHEQHRKPTRVPELSPGSR